MPTNKSKLNSNSESSERYSRRKRGLEPEAFEQETNEPSLSQSAKKQKPLTMSLNDELKGFFLNIKSELEKSISASQSSIETKLNDLTKNVNTEVNELKKSVDDLKSKFVTDIDAIKNHITEHTNRLNCNEDDINRLKLCADLRLNGIPFNSSENLIDLFHKIAAAIGFDSNNNANVPFMKRMPIRNKLTGAMVESSIIMLHFASVQQKQHFYSLYLKKMPLKPECIGLPKELKIIIGESLTRTNSQIFKYAQAMKKESKIAQLFTADGLVKIKFIKGPNQRAHTIRHTSQLDALLKEFKQQQHLQQLQNSSNQAPNVTPMETEGDKNGSQNSNTRTESSTNMPNSSNNVAAAAQPNVVQHTLQFLHNQLLQQQKQPTQLQQ